MWIRDSVNMALDMAIAYVLAVALNTKGLKARRIYKTLLIFPWAMPAYVSILVSVSYTHLIGYKQEEYTESFRSLREYFAGYEEDFANIKKELERLRETGGKLSLIHI